MEVKDIGQGRQLSLNINTSSNVAEIQDNKSSQNKDAGAKDVSEKDVKKAVDKVNKLMEDTSTHLKYEVYGKFRNIMVSIIDNNTNKVIKEIPPKSIVDMVDKLCEMAGIFLDKKA
ncbi:flagellar protein FlaG [Clostridium algifaecis]|uniref:Flagellar protein FlaG n=1 Tax=Clostridium algifaecis TaxID=1472040 RepID=A0ABS4KVZ2_9CLOT|nr:flagellar protein FlaG [Clostridium algifaecis]MBP2033815.1 flagellar protein FlaG [Clostridium algifaecis]